MPVVQFCGQDRCLVDANGRVKLGPRFLADFRRIGDQVILHCLPEGALGVYPVPVWHEMRQADGRSAAQAARSIAARRRLRRFGSMTQPDKITNQGRITVPAPFRDLLELPPGTDAVAVGCEIGVELWNVERWEREMELLREHERQKAEADMLADLQRTEDGPEYTAV